MSLYISIVSHGHATDITHGLQPHRLRGEGVQICILSNLNDPVLERYCRQHHLQYLQNKNPEGFGTNHNRVFRYFREMLGMENHDWFLVINPDVLVSPQAISDLLLSMQSYYPRLATINLFKDEEFTVLEGSVRRFPYLWDFFSSLVLKSTSTTIQRHDFKEPCHVDWASGAFLIFNAEFYQTLGGFDERYYLYCEDVDICWRARKLYCERVLYLPDIKAVHPGKRDSHKAFSRYMFWHISSAFRFSSVRLKTTLFGAKTLRRKQL